MPTKAQLADRVEQLEGELGSALGGSKASKAEAAALRRELRSAKALAAAPRDVFVRWEAIGLCSRGCSLPGHYSRNPSAEALAKCPHVLVTADEFDRSAPSRRLEF
jgi:hypothetical protein